MREDIKNRLTGAVRQFRHNSDNSPDAHNPREGFVFGYDRGEVYELIGDLLSELEAARAQQSGEGRVAIPRDVAEAHGMYLIGYSWLKHNAPNEINLPADKPERGWVKPEDQLPELTGWYCIALADPDDIGWSTSVSWVAFWNGDDFEECDPIEDGQPVTHWMPLPKPPAAPDMGGEK